MPPRGFTNPAPKTDSAKQAVKSFYCTSSYRISNWLMLINETGELCSKGYARMNEYEAHLSSYDHSHKQRLKDMRQLTRDPLASSKARKAEAKADKGMGLISIKLGGEGGVEGAEKVGGGSGSGFKKGGFKKAGFKSAFAPASDGVESQPAAVKNEERRISVDEGRIEGLQGGESDTDEGYEMYDPRFPTE
ncbi:G patch domain-containing protein [Lachnellula subtilissima]|uniref:G patch domain-containing protein n=1 Tax=Lachnellula subtilissima TaxID=602034 RepID=A0A8H8RHJ4_9HELO|nr:G patch domain-containing protein [Lachnellula subtilissima]